jgi:hypothetical protein
MLGLNGIIGGLDWWRGLSAQRARHHKEASSVTRSLFFIFALQNFRISSKVKVNQDS